MKKLFAFLYSMMLLFGVTTNGHATLSHFTNAGQDVVFESNSEQYWIWDLSALTNSDFTQQVNGIESYNSNSYYGFNNWHMATYDDMLSLWVYSPEDITSMFKPSYIYPENVWTAYDGRYNQDKGVSEHYCAGISVSQTGVMTKSGLLDYGFPNNMGATFLGAWVVADVTPVPEPATMLLLGTGIAGLAAVRRRKKAC